MLDTYLKRHSECEQKLMRALPRSEGDNLSGLPRWLCEDDEKSSETRECGQGTRQEKLRHAKAEAEGGQIVVEDFSFKVRL